MWFQEPRNLGLDDRAWQLGQCDSSVVLAQRRFDERFGVEKNTIFPINKGLASKFWLHFTIDTLLIMFYHLVLPLPASLVSVQVMLSKKLVI